MKHLLSAKDLTHDEAVMVLDTAEAMAATQRHAVKKLPTLRGKTVVNLFFEDSTRTRLSFEAAAKRLSADVINFSAKGSSLSKGESLKDTAQTSYVHLGYKADEASAKASLEQLKNQPGYDQIQAFTDRHVYGIYHQFYDAPYNFIAYLTFAKWQNPEAFSDVDPAKVWKDFHEQHMPWKAEGVFFAAI